MEMLISKEWLRRKVAGTPDIESDAGTPMAVLEDIGMFLPTDLIAGGEAKDAELGLAFGVLVRQLRRRDEMTVTELADKAQIDEAEIQSIETDPGYLPRPRTVHRVATVFKIPERAMMKLSGATVSRDTALKEAAQRFAAKSGDLSKLSREEQEALNEFVKYLIQESSGSR